MGGNSLQTRSARCNGKIGAGAREPRRVGARPGVISLARVRANEIPLTPEGAKA
jgi:hypothetical protein